MDATGGEIFFKFLLKITFLLGIVKILMKNIKMVLSTMKFRKVC